MKPSVVRCTTDELIYLMERSTAGRSLQCSLGGGGIYAIADNVWALEALVDYREREARRIQNLREGAFLP